jgi:hypothetical protein
MPCTICDLVSYSENDCSGDVITHIDKVSYRYCNKCKKDRKNKWKKNMEYVNKLKKMHSLNTICEICSYKYCINELFTKAFFNEDFHVCIIDDLMEDSSMMKYNKKCKTCKCKKSLLDFTGSYKSCDDCRRQSKNERTRSRKLRSMNAMMRKVFIHDYECVNCENIVPSHSVYESAYKGNKSLWRCPHNNVNISDNESSDESCIEYKKPVKRPNNYTECDTYLSFD